MQTILGTGGAIGNELAKILPQYTNNIRLVSRNPKAINQSDELFKADLSDALQTENAVRNSEVVYLTVGLQYKIEVWQNLWSKIMTNVINACEKNNCRLVFFDNVYMYGKVNGWMKEDTPINPSSRKGEIRAKIAAQLMDEVKKKNLTALIARAADFYGSTPNSILTAMVFEKLKNGKTAQWLVSDKSKHSFTYIPDAAKATAVLGNTDSAYNRVWHLPTDKNAMTGKEFIEAVATAFKVKPNYMVLKKWMLQLTGLFNPVVKEYIEMLYQQEYDYLFDSSDFEKQFFKATDYHTGIIQTAL
ncbi:MAG: NAD-dependent epimerase/dehydratase family protein [Ignavibacteriaceae bacterium]